LPKEKVVGYIPCVCQKRGENPGKKPPGGKIACPYCENCPINILKKRLLGVSHRSVGKAAFIYRKESSTYGRTKEIRPKDSILDTLVRENSNSYQIRNMSEPYLN